MVLVITTNKCVVEIAARLRAGRLPCETRRDQIGIGKARRVFQRPPTPENCRAGRKDHEGNRLHEVVQLDQKYAQRAMRANDDVPPARGQWQKGGQ